MEEKIINFLKKHPYSEKEMTLLLERDIHDVLEKMVKDGEILFYKRQYYLPERLKAKKARIISVKDRYAFAKIENEENDVYIDGMDLHGAFLDDAVFVRKIYGKHKECYEVLSIINRSRQNVVGEVRVLRGLFILDVKDLSTKKHDFIIGDNDFTLIPHSIVLGRIVETHDNYTIVKPIEILGSKNDPDVDILRIICSHDAPYKFPNEVLNEIKYIKTEVDDDDLKNRTSFIDHLIVTIDGESAKDFDDAVEVTKDAKGYHVGVHIADVTHYVKQNSAIDKEAESRATSLYCANKVVPMLPFELSNGICSLNPDVLRLVQSVLFDVDFNGNITNFSLHKGYIKSSARLTYTYVNNVLNGKLQEDKFSNEIDEMIFLLKEVSDLIRLRRKNNGCLDLNSTELIFDIDEDDKILDVKKRKQDVGERIIEDLMIQANEIVTICALNKNIPFLYRIHENPKLKRMNEFVKLSNNFNYPCDFDVFNVMPIDLQKHLDKIENEEKKKILSFYLLRALAKARYSAIHKSHFGLALENYTHFTSPIRRYPDLIVHRLLDYYFFNIGSEKDIKELNDNLFYLSENTSIRERRAQSIERAVDDLYSARFMKQFIGNSFDATVISLTAYGMYVELENGIEGFVPFDYSDEYFIYYESSFTALSSKGKKIKLGDKIQVILESCQIEDGRIMFSLPLNKKKHKIKAERKNHGRKSKINRQ